MSFLFGELRPDATAGERQVYQALAALPGGYYVYPELRVAGARDAHPDFVLFRPTLGVCTLSVKDWVDIVDADTRTFTVRTRDGRERSETHPLDNARDAAIAIAENLSRSDRLIHHTGRHQGKLILPWTYAVIFTNLNRLMVDWLLPVLSPGHLLCRDDLDRTRFEQRLLNLDWRFEPFLAPDQVEAVLAAIDPHLRPPAPSLEPLQVDAVRSTLDPTLIVTSTAGAVVGVLDLLQEKVAKEGIFDGSIASAGSIADAGTPGPAAGFADAAAPLPAADDLPAAGGQLARNQAVRLVRGVTGSGKTLVLAARARYLAQLHPDWRLLVVAFNEPLARDLGRRLRDLGDQVKVTHFHNLCKEWLEAQGLWKPPVNDRHRRIAHLLALHGDGGYDLSPHFLLDEFAWIKDTGITTLSAYLDEERRGRGARLSRNARRQVFDLFHAYQDHLRLRQVFDWEDLPHIALALIEDGAISSHQFDAILVDEAQDFAPMWFRVLAAVLNPATGVFFLAADSTQRIYRKFSWRSLGIDVMGHSRILPRSYRSTFEIIQTAAELIGSDATLQAQLREEEADLLEVHPDDGWMRHGPYPALHTFDNVEAERSFMLDWVRQLLAAGYDPGDIAIFHRRNYGVQNALAALLEGGISAVHLRAEAGSGDHQSVLVSTLHLAKGLEYRAVFISQLQALYHPDRPLPAREYPAFAADETRLLYVGLTRAREHVVLACEGKLPRELTGLHRFLSSHPPTLSLPSHPLTLSLPGRGSG